MMGVKLKEHEAEGQGVERTCMGRHTYVLSAEYLEEEKKKLLIILYLCSRGAIRIVVQGWKREYQFFSLIDIVEHFKISCLY